MCVVSMVMDHYTEVMDHYTDKFNDYLNPPNILPQQTPIPLPQPQINLEPRISDAEIREFKQLLERAREYDKKNNEPECELESKKNLVKELAEKLGVKIDFL